jgi:hypothetical protein
MDADVRENQLLFAVPCNGLTFIATDFVKGVK